jgi:hypothetical protein
MSAILLTFFISLMLVLAALVFIAKILKEGDMEHGDRLSLLPLEEEGAVDSRSEAVRS